MVLFRLLSAQPQTDGEHWKITGHLHNDDWHTDAYGQNPAPFYRNPFLGPPNRIPYPWQPGQITWPSNDAVFPSRQSFSLAVNTAVSPTVLDISGWVPVNTPPIGGLQRAPQVPLQATTANTGGNILPGTYLIAISGGLSGPVSNFILAAVPAGTNTNTITVSGIVWSDLGSFFPYIGANALSMRSAGLSTYSTASPDTYGNPTSVTFTSISAGGRGLPDQVFSAFMLEAYDISHGGVWGDAIGSLSGSAVLNFPSASWTVNQWAGYTLALYYRASIGPQDAINATVVSNTSNSLHLSVSGMFAAGDVVVMRPKPGSITSTTIGDANFINSYAPSGLVADGETGNLLWIIAGTGAGSPPLTIAGNTATVLTVAQPFPVTPDSTSVFIITSPSPRYQVATATSVNNGVFGPSLAGSIQTQNFAGGSLWIGAITMDSQGNWSPERYAPFREVWVPEFLTQDTVSTSPYGVSPNDDVLTFSGSASVVNLPPLASVIRHTITLINATTGALTINAASGDLIEGSASLSLAPGDRWQIMPNA